MPVMDRISKQQALDLCSDRVACSLPELGGRAGEIANQLHPGNIRTYIIERNINYTNICQTRCLFCAFSVSPRDDRGFTLDFEQIVSKIEPLLALGGRQILLQGGLDPHLPFDWYEQLLRKIKERFGRLHIHGFSPPEIFFFSRQFEMTIPQVIGKLREAGLDTIPGGGAEILVDRVRHMIEMHVVVTEQHLPPGPAVREQHCRAALIPPEVLRNKELVVEGDAVFSRQNDIFGNDLLFKGKFIRQPGNDLRISAA